MRIEFSAPQTARPKESALGEEAEDETREIGLLSGATIQSI
jgi:hypothetical protein